MQENIEIEYKQMLTYEQYNLIKNDFTKLKHKVINQTNQYFDTIDQSLYHDKQALRIRVIDQQYEICLKTKQTNDMLEKNIDIDEATYLAIMNNLNLLNNYFEDFNYNLISIGYLSTNRIEVSNEYGLFCLDLSNYNNMEDYELEFEAINYQQEDYFKDFLSKYNIIYTNDAITKIKRCLNTK